MDFLEIDIIILGNPQISCCKAEIRLIALLRIQKQKYLASCQIKVLLTRVKWTDELKYSVTFNTFNHEKHFIIPNDFVIANYFL